MIVERKLEKHLFEQVEKGEKTFDMRVSDIACRKGDVVILKEWDEEAGAYTGRTIEREVSFALHSNELKRLDLKTLAEQGIQVVSLR